MNPTMRFALVDLVAANEGPSPPRAAFYGFLAAILGNSALGLGVTLVLANQEAEQTPPPQPTGTNLPVVTP